MADAAGARHVAGKTQDAESQDLMIGRITLHQKTIDLEPNQIIPGMVPEVTAMSEKNLAADDVTIVLIRPNGAPLSMRANLLAPFRYLSNLLGMRE